MTPESVLEQAAEALLSAYLLGQYRGHLCFWKGKLQALHHHHTYLEHPIFFNFNGDHLTEGLSTQEWDTLKTNLWNFFKEKR